MCIRDRGINDTWRRYDSNLPTTAEQYEKNMRAIIESCLSVGAKIIILAPFAVPGSSIEDVYKRQPCGQSIHQ